VKPAQEYNRHINEAQRAVRRVLDFSRADPDLRELMQVKVHKLLEDLKMPESTREA
jgi:hypothetical protein